MYDFNEIKGMYFDDAEEYGISHPNQQAAIGDVSADTVDQKGIKTSLWVIPSERVRAGCRNWHRCRHPDRPRRPLPICCERAADLVIGGGSVFLVNGIYRITTNVPRVSR